MVDECQKCNNHEDEKLCRRCNTCQRQHVQKYGIKWVQNKHDSSKPCIHRCFFTLPNNQKIEYKCTKNMGHTGQCNFGVNIQNVEKMAKDSVGR